MTNFLYAWSDSVCENLNNLSVECGGHVNRLCIYIVNSFDSNNNYWFYRGVQFAQEGDCLEFMNAFEIPARDAVPMEVMSVLIFSTCTFVNPSCGY